MFQLTKMKCSIREKLVFGCYNVTSPYMSLIKSILTNFTDSNSDSIFTHILLYACVKIKLFVNSQSSITSRYACCKQQTLNNIKAHEINFIHVSKISLFRGEILGTEVWHEKLFTCYINIVYDVGSNELYDIDLAYIYCNIRIFQ